MADQPLAEVLALLVERAPALREAGVLELEHGSLKVRLAPHVDTSVSADPGPREELPPLEDPESYGLPPGSPVPGFAALRKRRQGEA